MPTTQFDTTITDEGMIRVPDDWQFEIGTPVRVIKLTPQPPTDEEADEMMAKIKARVARITAGEFDSEEDRRAFESFSRFRGSLPKDWKFDREEIYERG